MTVAMAAEKLASLLDNAGPSRVDADIRKALIESQIRKANLDLSPQGEAELLRSVQRIVSDSSHTAWTSLPIVRASISLGLWQAATELALRTAGELLCGGDTSKSCSHEPRGFVNLSEHWLGAVNDQAPEDTGRLREFYRMAQPVSQLRNSLLHGDIGEEDRQLLDAKEPARLAAPLAEFLSHIVHTTLAVGFADPDPDRTIAEVMFSFHGLPPNILREAMEDPGGPGAL